MVSKTFVIMNQGGLHLKPAERLCTEAMKYKSTITLAFGSTRGNAKSMLNVLSACVKCNDEITIECSGVDEEEALVQLTRLIEDGLGE